MSKPVQSKSCASCGLEPRVGTTQYCSPCRKAISVRSIEANRHKPCSMCGAAPRAYGSYCTPCNAVVRRKSRNRTRGLPCVDCGESARMAASARCSPCRSVLERSRRYGVTQKNLDDLLIACGGACEICQTPVALGGRESGSAVVDHNHETGEVRGILCAPCNSGIGMLKDNPDVLRQAANYLEARGSYAVER